jgi:hypothetical protein
MTKSKNLYLFVFSFSLYFLLFLGYALFSYSLTSPNLVLSTNPTFWKFQTWMWATFFENAELLTKTYLGLMIGIFLSYAFFVLQFLRIKISGSVTILAMVVFLSLPLLASNNALSYDVFNYIFNAKMVMSYDANPHAQVALDFATDPWVRFMHNTHTPAPYGYGWTLLSLIPFGLGMGKFVLTWLSFRIFSLIGFLGLGLVFLKTKLNKNNLILFLFNPLVLIEVISNSHNDFWMIFPAIVALILVAKKQNKKFYMIGVFTSFALLFLSISIKLATVALLPVWLLILFRKKLKSIPRIFSLTKHWALTSSIIMFLPLLSARAQQFHPWYLIWPLAFIPLFGKNRLAKVWRNSLLILSVSSMIRYAPFLWQGNFDGDVLMWQKSITFIPFILYLGWQFLQTFRKK